MRSLVYVLVALFAFPALALAETDPKTGTATGSPATGAEASVPATRQSGGYNNYCQTWRVYREQDRKRFGACLAGD